MEATLKQRIVVLMLLCLLFVAVYEARAAFTIDPAQIIFLTDRGEKTGFVEIVHVSGGPAAIQFSVYDRTLDIDGNLVSTGMTASSDFIVHPAQVILYPKERATVQIQYRAKKKITGDRAYVLLSQEVPIQIEEDQTGDISVKMLTNYYTVLALETNKPGKLVFVSSKEIGDGKIEVIAENKGSGRVHMDRIFITVGGRLIANFTGKSNSVMPGTQRRFTFEYPRAVTAKEVQFGR
jgi:P pilus assembly chaperone PapD